MTPSSIKPTFKSTPSIPIGLLGLFLLANIILVSPTPVPLRLLSALLLLCFLPGWYWGQLFSSNQLQRTERLLIAVGLSLALTIFTTLFLSYLPDPLTFAKLMVGLNGLILVGMGLARWQATSQVTTPSGNQTGKLMVALIFGVLLLAAVLRLPMLGYAEFHEDEAEVLMLGTRLFQGENYALFLHRKGPAQMLVPIAFWLLDNRITEMLARLPFAISSILSVGVIFLLGWRWGGTQKWVGLIAAILWAINGYSIAFGRMVQYQSLILFLGPLAIYCHYLAWRLKQPKLQFVTAILLAASLLAHFDAWIFLPMSLYLAWLIVIDRNQSYEIKGPKANHIRQEDHEGKTKGLSAFIHRFRVIHVLSQPAYKAYGITLLAAVLLAALVAAFYIPFLRDPEFSNTAAYLRESRIRPGFLYNNLAKFQDLDKDYSSHFYLPLLAIGIIGLVVEQLRSTNQWSQWLLGLSLGLVATTISWPNLWEVGQLSLAIIPWLILFSLSVWVAATVEQRLMWLLFAVPMLAYVFVVGDPRTHVLLAYPGAILLAASGFSWLAEMGANRLQVKRRVAPLTILGVSSVCVGLIVVYASLIYLQSESDLNRVRANWDRSPWEMVYDDLPKRESYFGYPKQTGWKAIGALQQQGQLSRDFKSLGEDFVIPVWYSYGQSRSCFEQPTHYFTPLSEADFSAQLAAYVPIAQIQREHEPTLQIFSMGKRDSSSMVYHFEDLAPYFDQVATPQQFVPRYQPQQSVAVQFESGIELVGYDLPATAIRTGEMLQVNLYWQALNKLDRRYRAFVHLVDETGLRSQHDDDPICRLPTTVWRAGQRGVGHFRLPLDITMPAGNYAIIMGLYQANSQTRLKIIAGGPTIGDDFLWLGDVQLVD